MKNRLLVFGAFTQIFLLISMSFALAFLLQENLVSSASPEAYNDPALLEKVQGGRQYESATTPLPNPNGAPGQVAQAAATKFVSSPSGPGNVMSFKDAAGIPYEWDSGDNGWVQSTPNVNSVEAKFIAGSQGVPSGATSVTSGIGKYDPPSIMGKTFFVNSPFLGHLAQGLMTSTMIIGVIQLLGVFGVDKGLTNSLSMAAFGGIMTYQAIVGAYSSPTVSSALGLQAGASGKYLGLFKSPGQAGAYIGLAVAVAIFILTYSKEKKKTVNFQCMPYEPPLKGDKCEECNKDPMRPCSEYKCKSLGQACSLLNAGTGKEQCAWVSRNDVKSPEITPWDSALYPIGLKYAPDKAIRPPSIGTKIVSSSDGCLPAYTPLQFGVTTNEPAQCKIDYNHTAKFENMQYYFGDTNYYLYNHTQKMRLPGPNTGNNSIAPELKNDGNFALYVRCQDANGNQNVDEYAFTFCVDKSDDTTQPIIEEFSIPSGSYIRYNQDSVPIEVYVNEPSECKWSVESKPYDDMENTMKCYTDSYQVNADLQYVCTGNLTGVQNREENKFYFKCKDQPDAEENKRNVNVQGKELILKGSQPLNIIKILPNETITGSTDVVPVSLEVETDDGAENGIASCAFSASGAKDSFITMFQTGSFEHNQTLMLPNGLYTYFVRCIDVGGNAAEANTTFAVYVDKNAPSITRVYKQEALKIVTDEDAECSYSLKDCNFNFEDGKKMAYSNVDIKYNLYADWKAGNVYYIKCRDLYGNQPDPNRCSITVSAIELSAQTN